MQFDRYDRQLLEVLQMDGRISNQDLAQRVALSPSPCLRRVKRLIEGGWIERQVAVLSHDRLAVTLGHGLTSLVEVSLSTDMALKEKCTAFESIACKASAPATTLAG